MTSTLKLLSASSAMAAILAASAPAYAANTDANTLITNNVAVTYAVGGVNQTPPGSELTAQNQFRVDRKVMFTITEKTAVGTTAVTSGQVGAVVAYTLVNNSNDTLDFSLLATNLASGATVGGGRGVDNINVSNFQYAIDADGNGALNGSEAFSSTLTLNDIAKGTTLTAGTTVHILVRSDIPLATNGSVATVRLAATALNSNGSAITAVDDTAANTADITSGTFQTIFGDDLAPALLGNTSRDGTSWAYDDYTVSAASLNVVKTSRVISDGVSTSNFKAIPGAVVEYCISVTNTGSATAQNISVSDVVPTNTTFVNNSVYLNGAVTSPGVSQTCARSGGSAVTSSGLTTVTGTLNNLTDGSTTPTSTSLIFQVTID
jgi:uncharacterized repeat protein (TIGR01451 family)